MTRQQAIKELSDKYHRTQADIKNILSLKEPKKPRDLRPDPDSTTERVLQFRDSSLSIQDILDEIKENYAQVELSLSDINISTRVINTHYNSVQSCIIVSFETIYEEHELERFNYTYDIEIRNYEMELAKYMQYAPIREDYSKMKEKMDLLATVKIIEAMERKLRNLKKEV